MNNQIKEFVEECRIHEKREKLIQTKEMLFRLDREMAKMTFNYNVGRYAHLLDKYEKLEINDEKEAINEELMRIEKDIDIIRYLELRKEYFMFKTTLDEYPKSINVDFRNKFLIYNVPNIFVFQGYVGENKELLLARNIILPEIKEIYTDTKDDIIYPMYNIDSNRGYRHFYNKVSFKYLEEMTRDYNFDLTGKNIGKIRMLKYN